MCGIFSYFCRSNINVDKKSVIEAALKIQHRGPDETHIIHSKFPVNTYRPEGFDKFHLIFHRLMVNGLSPESSQPLVYPLGKPRYYLLCNGEIYNYKDLIAKYNLESQYHSSSDCEILLHLFNLVTEGKMTMEEMLLELRGVFAFVIVDIVSKKVTLARDPIGVRSLYYSFDDKGFGLCSELKGLYQLAEPSSINQFPAGCYGTVDCRTDNPNLNVESYYSIVKSGETYTSESMETAANLSTSVICTPVRGHEYSGEGRDELFGSYLYFHNAPSDSEFHQETLRLVNDLQYFDVLRGDKSSAVAGLEIRTPFLDIDFVNYVATIPPDFKLFQNIEKYVLRKALTEFLPEEICWRTKEAMSDGVSLHNRSWSTIIQDYIFQQQQSHRRFVNNPYGHDLSTSKAQLEKAWFKRVFSTAYQGCEHTVPYDWLPKWCGNVVDSSARVLEIYKQKNETNNETINEVL